MERILFRWYGNARATIYKCIYPIYPRLEDFSIFFIHDLKNSPFSIRLSWKLFLHDLLPNIIHYLCKKKIISYFCMKHILNIFSCMKYIHQRREGLRGVKFSFLQAIFRRKFRTLIKNSSNPKPVANLLCRGNEGRSILFILIGIRKVEVSDFDPMSRVNLTFVRDWTTRAKLNEFPINENGPEYMKFILIQTILQFMYIL